MRNIPNSPSHSHPPDKSAWLRRALAATAFAALLLSLLAAAGLLSVEAGREARPQALGTERIIINEVAWMGTGVSANHEWIELYNPSSDSVTITGWRLRTTDSAINIVLNGMIPGYGYFLLERTSDTTISNITADQTYTGALNNTTATLELLNDSDVLIDTANFGGTSWPAGNNTTKCSMERIGPVLDISTNWMTSTINTIGLDENGNPICGSPKAQNSQFITPTPTLTPSPTQPFERIILINEIAWGGTTADGSAGQWIELHNPDPIEEYSRYRLDACRRRWYPCHRLEWHNSCQRLLPAGAPQRCFFIHPS
jgi:hypothetical protein